MVPGNFRGRRVRTRLPALRDANVELVSIDPWRAGKTPGVWTVELKINGWPYETKMWGKDELDVMRAVMLMREQGATVWTRNEIWKDDNHG